MKKLFNRTKRPEQEWEGYDESEYDWDSDGEAYEDTVYEDDSDEEYYYRDDELAEDADAYYADEEVAEEPEYYAEAQGDDGYYESDADVDFIEEDLEEDSYEGESDGYYADTYETETDGYVEPEDEEPVVVPVGRTGGRRKAGFMSKLQQGLASMGVMDRIILATGVGVLILALITGSVYVSSRIIDRQVSGFITVGTQLENIDVIGGAGLLAVADAQMARLAAAGMLDSDFENQGYDEGEYEREVTVALEMVSIQRDLKVKFVNQRTDKLIANVPFTITITDPNGNTSVWSDDDMDGIIYKKDITPGNYQVVMEPLTDTRYADYIISTTTESVEVKKDIDYRKVNVANEVKSESEVNAQKEDTKVNETQVEGALQDTVEWVESRVLSASYNEVPKSSIPDPMTLLALNKTFMRAVSDGDESLSPTVAPPSEEPTGSPSPSPSVSPSPSPSVSPSPSPSVSPSPSPTATPNLGLTVSPSTVTVVVKGTATTQATATGVPTGKTVSYSVSSSNNGIATVSNSGGTITITGVAAGTAEISVTASYTADDNSTVSATAKFNVTVTGTKALTLDRTAATVFIDAPVTINATITNAVNTDPTVTAVSSDTSVATVSVDKKAVTISGVKAGTATITVSFTENNETVQATCTVTVKDHPKNNKTDKLKDSSGNQLYVNENGNYREAVYADFYNTSLKFYLRGETRYQGWQTIDGKVYFFTAEGKKVTGEQVIQGAKYNFASDGSLVQGDGVLGIDVSKWNGTIDWSAVKNSGISYVIIRCGYRGSSAGSLIEDPKFTTNIKGATAAGLKVGVYFFTQAIDEREAVEEASMVLNQVRNYTISYPIFLDVEASGGRADSIDKTTRTAVCRAFCQTIQNEGYTAGIYANKTWLNTKIDASALSSYKIWLAQYAATPTYTGRYDLWQYRATGSVSGISGDVDMNISYLGY